MLLAHGLSMYVQEWWKHKDDPNVLFLKYKDMKDHLGAVRAIAEFIG